MKGYKDMPIEEMVRIEDKEILQTAPFRPAATKYPEPYLRVLQNLSLKWKLEMDWGLYKWILQYNTHHSKRLTTWKQRPPLRAERADQKASNTWFPNWEKCGLNFATPNLFRNWTYVTDFYGKMDQHPESRHRTSFSCEYGTFQYRVLPMGLIIDSVAFQRWVQGRLKKHNLWWQRVNIGEHPKVHTSTKTTNDVKDGRRAICKTWLFLPIVPRTTRSILPVYSRFSKKRKYTYPSKNVHGPANMFDF